jgi:hypothetical protein
MIEVFKTNIDCANKAEQLAEQIHKTITSNGANFDLNDCGRILCAVSSNSSVSVDDFIE